MPQPLTGRAAWTGAELERSGDWIRTLNDAQRQEIGAALDAVKRRGLPLMGFRREDFSLDTTAALLTDINDELENGRGAVRLRGLDVRLVTAKTICGRFSGASAAISAPRCIRTPAARSWAKCATKAGSSPKAT